MAPLVRFSTASGLTMQRVRSTGMFSLLWLARASKGISAIAQGARDPDNRALAGRQAFFHHADEGARHGARVRGNTRSCGLERTDLLGGRAFPARDDGPSVAHALARRRCRARDEGGDGLVHLLVDEH